MARVSRPDQDEKLQLGPDGQPVAPGGDNFPGDIGGGGQAAAAPAQGAGSQRFPDISRLLSANAGRGQGVAQSGIAGADALGNQAVGQLGLADNQLRSQVAAGTPAAYTAAPGAAAGTGGGLGAGSRARGLATTTQNVAPNLEAAQAASTSSYSGPTALGNSTADLSGAQAALAKAGGAYGALSQGAPSRATGGAGFLNNTLAQQEAGGDLRAAGQRFQGLRDRFNAKVGDTSISDAAKAATAKSAAAGQSDVAANNASIADVNQSNTDFVNQQNAGKTNGDRRPDYSTPNDPLQAYQDRYDAQNVRDFQAGVGTPAPNYQAWLDANNRRPTWNDNTAATRADNSQLFRWEAANRAGNTLPFQDWAKQNPDPGRFVG